MMASACQMSQHHSCWRVQGSCALLAGASATAVTGCSGCPLSPSRWAIASTAAAATRQHTVQIAWRMWAAAKLPWTLVCMPSMPQAAVGSTKRWQHAGTVPTAICSSVSSMQLRKPRHTGSSCSAASTGGSASCWLGPADEQVHVQGRKVAGRCCMCRACQHGRPVASGPTRRPLPARACCGLPARLACILPP